MGKVSHLQSSQRYHGKLPNLRKLCFDEIPVIDKFLEPGLEGSEAIPPCVQELTLVSSVLDGSGWAPLKNFLADRNESSGERLDTLGIRHCPQMCQEMEGEIKSLDRVFDMKFTEVTDSELCVIA